MGDDCVMITTESRLNLLSYTCLVDQQKANLRKFILLSLSHMPERPSTYSVVPSTPSNKTTFSTFSDLSDKLFYKK